MVDSTKGSQQTNESKSEAFQRAVRDGWMVRCVLIAWLGQEKTRSVCSSLPYWCAFASFFLYILPLVLLKSLSKQLGHNSLQLSGSLIFLTYLSEVCSGILHCFLFLCNILLREWVSGWVHACMHACVCVFKVLACWGQHTTYKPQFLSSIVSFSGMKLPLLGFEAIVCTQENLSSPSSAFFLQSLNTVSLSFLSIVISFLAHSSCGHWISFWLFRQGDLRI